MGDGVLELVSPWLADTGDLRLRPPLPGDRDVDVAILGAGYTGLWTALELLRRNPDLRIGVVDAHYAGFGGSGRNGAWCVAGLGPTLGETARRYGDEVARRTIHVMRETVNEVGRVCDEDLPQAQFCRGGVLRIARGGHQWPAVRESFALRQRLGLADGCALLTAQDLAARVRVRHAVGALFDEHCATIHPGHLVRGLAALAEQRGTTIWEQTRATEVLPAGPSTRARLVTEHGTLSADVVVLAGESYLSQLPGLQRHVMPVYSLVVMTEPLQPSQLDAIGWAGRECLSSHLLTVDYVSRTADGRVVFGGRGAPYHYGSSIAPPHDRHAATHERLRGSLLDWFPALGGIRFTHEWGGPVGICRDWLPTFSYHARTGIAAAFGYTGQGVAGANLGGRVLADLITGQPQRWTWLPAVGHRPRRWEPEPLRWLAVRFLQGALARLDRRSEATGTPPTGRSLAERLTRH